MLIHYSLANSTTKKRYPPWTSQDVTINGMLSHLKWFLFREHLFIFGWRVGVSLPTLADLRLKSLELPSRSALAAQLRAERIQRATLARQKQLQRLVRGTRGGYKWGRNIDRNSLLDKISRGKLLFMQLRKGGDPLSCVTNWELVSWAFLLWPKERICFWRVCPWLILTSSEPYTHSIAINLRWQLKFPMSLFSKVSTNNLYTLDTVDFP